VEIPHGRRQPFMPGHLLRALLFALLLLPGHASALPDTKPGADAGTPKPAAAQAPAAQANIPTASTDDLKALLATLQDPAARDRLIAQLQTLIALRQQGAGAGQPAPSAPSPEASGAPGVQAIEATSGQIRHMSEALVAGVSVLLDFPRLVSWTDRQLGDEATRVSWILIGLKLAAVLAAALISELIAGFLLRGARRAAGDRESATLWVRLLLLLGRVFVDLLRIAAFGAAAYIVLPLIDPGDFARAVALAFINANVIVRACLVVARALLAPEGSRIQPLSMRPETAGYWYVWFRRLIGLGVYGYAFAAAALIVGLPVAGYDVVVKALGLLLAALLIILVFQNRAAMAEWIRGRDAGDADRRRRSPGLRVLRARLADVWHLLAVLYVVGFFGVWAAQIPGGFQFIARASLISILVVVAGRAVISTGDGLLHRFLSIGTDLKQRFPGLEARANRYLPILVSLLHTVFYVTAAVILTEAWGINSVTWLRSRIARGIIGDLATIAVTVVVAVAIWEGVSFAMEYYFFRQATESRHRWRYGRARTLLPLIRRTVAIVLIVFVALIGLSELGVNIAPLLAGAGVVGIAVGFGAQSFVKDLINGMHLLMEDTVGVGDSVTIGSDTGEVEAISMRTIRLRDGQGAVHTIPFSEVSRVINSSRDFSRAVLEVPIGFSENYERIIEMMEKIAAELRADPALAQIMLSPPTPAVLDRFSDYAMIVRMEIKTQPGKQGEITRAFNRRLKRRLDEMGVALPYPAQRMYMATNAEAEDSKTDAKRPARRA